MDLLGLPTLKSNAYLGVITQNPDNTLPGNGDYLAYLS